LPSTRKKRTPPQPRDEDIAAKLSVTWGLYCQVHRLARASILLADNGMGQEGIVLSRVMLEHTIVLHWVIARGDNGYEHQGGDCDTGRAHEDVVVLESCAHDPVTRRPVGTQGREVDVARGLEKLPDVIGDRNCHAVSSELAWVRSRRQPARPMTSWGTSRPMAPLEYTLTMTRPPGSITKPVDCR
jgi:hypothetical protein